MQPLTMYIFDEALDTIISNNIYYIKIKFLFNRLWRNLSSPNKAHSHILKWYMCYVYGELGRFSLEIQIKKGWLVIGGDVYVYISDLGLTNEKLQ